MDCEIKDIRRRAGLTESYDYDAEEKIMAEEKGIESHLQALYKKAGVPVERVLAEVIADQNIIETIVYVDDSEITIAQLAKLREVGALTLTSVVSMSNVNGPLMIITTKIERQAPSPQVAPRAQLPTRRL